MNTPNGTIYTYHGYFYVSPSSIQLSFYFNDRSCHPVRSHLISSHLKDCVTKGRFPLILGM